MTERNDSIEPVVVEEGWVVFSESESEQPCFRAFFVEGLDAYKFAEAEDPHTHHPEDEGTPICFEPAVVPALVIGSDAARAVVIASNDYGLDSPELLRAHVAKLDRTAWPELSDGAHRLVELTAECDKLRHERNVAARAASDGVWLWDEDADNDVASMCADMLVTLRADTLRALLSEARLKAEPPRLSHEVSCVTCDGTGIIGDHLGAVGCPEPDCCRGRRTVPCSHAHAAVRGFANAIMHGDRLHRDWLVRAAEAYIAQEPLPPADDGRAA